jgi:hypothetical protein
MNDENLDPKVKKSIDESLDWIREVLELERDFGMEAVIRAVDECDEEQVRKVCFCLLVNYAADSRRMARLVQNWRSAPLN